MKTNEIVRIQTKSPRRYVTLYLVFIWKFFGNFLAPAARRLFRPCQVIFWNFLSYILFHVVTSCAAACYEYSLPQYIRLCGACQ